MVDLTPNIVRKGRGAISNETGRYETTTHHPINDGWDIEDKKTQPLRTVVTNEWPKTIITHNQSHDLPFHYSINPYRGCEHGCIYCFARPTHAYHGLSPGLDFESKLFAKQNSAALLEIALRKPGYIVNPIAIGTNTDPYQPIEKSRRIMRQILEVLSAYNHPVSILTKSTLVLRDLDILNPMAERGLVTVGLSVTTLNGELARNLEPRAATPAKRLKAIQKLSNARVPAFCLAAPMIPGLNDHELEAIVEAAAINGASGASYVLLRLPLEIKDLFIEWLKNRQPARASKVLSMIRECWGGSFYISDWGTRQRGVGPYATLLEARMNRLRKRFNLINAERPAEFRLTTKLFRPPPQVGDQLQLL